MVEPPHKRPRRSDSDMDRRRDSPERNSRDTRDRGVRVVERGGRDRYDRDSNRERETRYRSRSQERERDRHPDPGRERGGRRDKLRDRDSERDRESLRSTRRDGERERDSRDAKDGGRGMGNRGRERGDRKQLREEEDNRRTSRSRSPARDLKVHIDAEQSPAPARALEIDAPRGPKSRTATPPVAFKVSAGAHGHTGPGHKNGHVYKESPGDNDGDRGHTPAAYDSEAMDTDIAKHENPTGSKSKGKKISKQNKVQEKNIEDDEEIIVEEDGSMVAMQAMLGFGGFGTTKQKKVVGNDVYAVRKEKKTEYRQYMNRVGGFNRPLSPSRD